MIYLCIGISISFVIGLYVGNIITKHKYIQTQISTAENTTQVQIIGDRTEE